ncbi:hypothetical protein EVG20_g5640 [Dentipellis fragilis]|uniref:Uncharacterized protein n=1 Tax=Dentipellis fragilis TaxID=205917 RepID=A0A4Y9YS98_9AGAM|nr:hypothetical protein EVG20_g5640 [Dentipellis fragilis]
MHRTTPHHARSAGSKASACACSNVSVRYARPPPPSPVVGVPPYTGAHPSLPPPFGRYNPDLTRAAAGLLSVQFPLYFKTSGNEDRNATYEDYAAMFEDDDAMYEGVDTTYEDSDLAEEEEDSTDEESGSTDDNSGDDESESDDESVMIVTELRSTLSDSSGDEDTDDEEAADADNDDDDNDSVADFMQHAIKPRRALQQRERVRAPRRC